MPGSSDPAPVSDDGEQPQEGTDDAHAGHEVQKLAEDVDPLAGFARDKYYCWDCGVGWSA